ncbi:hypothetical protein PV328_010406 [Microctonus aethiopoides]|uniref:Protein kinase domain-containing protein n=1 Tax=Microctonus aethiopoides TaxID=144406 RepID=A0AA39KQ54_9HYME|nr:hypothetical protein PV328_010406 [Microctonus aethiopoides]
MLRDIIHRDRNRRTLPTDFNGLNNEAYRAALNTFLERRKNLNESEYILSPNSPDKARYILQKNEKNTIKNNANNGKSSIVISKLPNADPSEIFEIGWVAGTEDRYLDLMCAEWQNTKVCLRRHTHPDCQNAVKADLEVLSEIRHPNILLLMGITHTDDNGIIAICEPIDCTLYNYIHEQGERMAMQGVAKCARNLAAAIKHAHMLGYIHSAISPHCVFLSSNGIMKLGGFELAINVNGPKGARNYEKRLRSEIFRWQAPELFIRQKVSTATDVYGLTLLIWEMCTMNIPWNGLNFAEVERHYVQRKRGITISLHNFPPLLVNLLETGMQLDISKRTLDINKISRLLKQLEMRYEDAEPVYIEQLMNNNDQTKSIFTTPIKILPSHKVSGISNCVDTKIKRQYSEKINSFATSKGEKKVREEKRQERREHLFENQGNRMKLKNEILQTKNNDHNNYINSETKLNKIEVNELKKPQLNLDSQCNANEICNLIDKDTDYAKDSRLSIKKLKETLANQRQNFFYGDNSSDDPIPLIDELSKTNILCHVRSKDYKPHKPASHKTSLEPKQIPSSSQNLSNGPRSIYKKNQRMPYAYVPTPIRNAVIQPQILNSDSNSFFETSLWQREKSICLSKMSGNNSDDYKSCYQYKTDHTQFSKNKCQANETFTVDDHSLSDNSKDNYEYFAQINDSSVNITASTIPRSKSLQALKDALERVTSMARPASPIISSSIDATPLKIPKALNGAIDNSDMNKLKHIKVSKLNVNPRDEIRGIERSISYTTFNRMPEQSNKSNTERKLVQNVNNYETQIVFPKKTSITSPPIPAPRKLQCTTAEISSNKNHFFIVKEKTIGKNPVNSMKIETNTTSRNKVIYTNANECFPVFISNDQSTRETECSSCSRNSLFRPRSLPAHLELLNTNSYTSLEKVPRKLSESSNDTVEDLYIDDEFGEYDLAPNMILMNEDTATDEDNYFPDLLESKSNPVYSQI